MYCGITLFNNRASSKIDVFHQVSLEDSDTVYGKDQYEAYAADDGVRVMKYVWNNRVCKSKEFKEALTIRQ